MRNLTQAEITFLYNRKGVKAIAVDNFCGTLEGSTYGDALQNLRADARSYGWNAPTVQAITDGIMVADGRKHLRIS
jgi:hypothetical protein